MSLNCRIYYEIKRRYKNALLNNNSCYTKRSVNAGNTNNQNNNDRTDISKCSESNRQLYTMNLTENDSLLKNKLNTVSSIKRYHMTDTCDSNNDSDISDNSIIRINFTKKRNMQLMLKQNPSSVTSTKKTTTSTIIHTPMKYSSKKDSATTNQKSKERCDRNANLHHQKSNIYHEIDYQDYSFSTNMYKTREILTHNDNTNSPARDLIIRNRTAMRKGLNVDERCFKHTYDYHSCRIYSNNAKLKRQQPLSSSCARKKANKFSSTKTNIRSTSDIGSIGTCCCCSLCDCQHHPTSSFTCRHRNSSIPNTTTTTRRRQLLFNLCQCTIREEKRNTFTIHSNPLANTSLDNNGIRSHSPIPLIDEMRNSSRIRNRSLVPVASRQIPNSPVPLTSSSIRLASKKAKRTSSFAKPSIPAVTTCAIGETTCFSTTSSTNGTRSMKNMRSGTTTKQTTWNQEEKAFRQLFAIVFGFICCFLPYFILYMVVAFCEHCVSQRQIIMSTWLGYANSTINPFLYALSNKHFRRTFNRILKRDQRRQSYYN
ncbi:unnamed protein product [Didymodactylos carnosus]|uniref:G-protein coupled receptors family 1 profile domain-containing protein n=1 Tax=Didymodactylos carnosus TaxID=1234261 RepID=A0A814G8X3_9BILA|nr:unnamed protein product [Didymodactylos carnosus]CAF0990629.1 unnamed protein product [Didymodactylos carnosus]CAF3571319.1 unnamed protein product [Didymodactylos carnosus]CAF3762627.1 unnamed protein product [Didymodactylos carnosus]